MKKAAIASWVFAGLVAGVILSRLFLQPSAPAPLDLVVAGQELAAAPGEGLSQPTRAVLSSLPTPVEIRFYAVWNPDRVSPELSAFAQRVSNLLSQFERVSDGKVRARVFQADSHAQDQAMQDGIQPQRVTRGEMNFLGLAAVCQDHRAVLPRLDPGWEPALEFDISRAIAQVARLPAPAEAVLNPPSSSTAATEELFQVLPELNGLSLDEARRQVREAGLEEFKLATAQIQDELHQAHQQLAQAQQQSPEAAQRARQHVRQLQSEQNARLSQITQRMQERLAVLEQLKGNGGAD